MGEEPPVDDPTFEPDKWYCVHLDLFQGGGPPWDCTQNHVGDIHVCVDGEDIQDWLDGGWECNSAKELVPVTGFTAQKILDHTGPYDTQNECVANC